VDYRWLLLAHRFLLDLCDSEGQVIRTMRLESDGPHEEDNLQVWRGAIVSSPDVLHGKPGLKGTRTP
jgi:hypothetical protein